MKKIFIFFLFAILLSSFSYAQQIQASLGAGSQSTRVKIYLRPTATLAATISTLQFNLGILTSVTPKPTLTVVSTAFAGVTWVVTEFTEGGYNHYSLTTATSPITFNAVANTEFEALEVQFANGPASANMVSLVTLPDGGSGASNGNALFLSTGNLISDGANLYYTRGGVTVNNQNSYDETGMTSGVATSTATIGGVILPVHWLNFSAARQANNVQLDWSVIESDEDDFYELQVSTNGSSFSTLTSKARQGSNGTKNYSHLDQLVNRYSKNILYYRIKAFSKDGSFTFSETRTIRLDLKGEISLYPNPAKKGFYLTIPYVTADQKKVKLFLVNGIGQVIEKKEITRLAATNYYYELKSPSIISGEHLLRIYEDDVLLDVKKVLIQK